LAIGSSTLHAYKEYTEPYPSAQLSPIPFSRFFDSFNGSASRHRTREVPAKYPPKVPAGGRVKGVGGCDCPACATAATRWNYKLLVKSTPSALMTLPRQQRRLQALVRTHPFVVPL